MILKTIKTCYMHVPSCNASYESNLFFNMHYLATCPPCFSKQSPPEQDQLPLGLKTLEVDPKIGFFASHLCKIQRIGVVAAVRPKAIFATLKNKEPIFCMFCHTVLKDTTFLDIFWMFTWDSVADRKLVVRCVVAAMLSCCAAPNVGFLISFGRDVVQGWAFIWA